VIEITISEIDQVLLNNSVKEEEYLKLYTANNIFKVTKAQLREFYE